jgi:hypothetical protein
MNCGYCGAEQKKGETFRTSSVDCMESPPLQVHLNLVGKVCRVLSNRNGQPVWSRLTQYSINNPTICESCQNGLDSLDRACSAIKKEKA